MRDLRSAPLGESPLFQPQLPIPLLTDAPQPAPDRADAVEAAYPTGRARDEGV